MVKKRVHELAKEMEMSSKDLLNKLIDIGLPVKNHMSTIPSEEVNRIKGSKTNKTLESIIIDG